MRVYENQLRGLQKLQRLLEERRREARSNHKDNLLDKLVNHKI
jgi:hypothetical protein